MFGGAEAGAVEDFGRSTQFIGLQLEEAAQRNQRRDDAITNSRVYNQRNRERQEAFNTTKGTQDFSDPAVFNGFLREQDAADLELLNSYQGSTEGLLALEEQLLGLSDRYTAAAISDHSKAAFEAAEITVNSQAEPLIIQLFRQPERAQQTFAELAEVARRTAPVFDTITEDQLLRTLNDKASAAIIEGLRTRPDAAQAALNDLIAEDKISSGLAIDAQRRIDNLQVELDLRAAAGSGTGDLVALPDPSSSTGFRFVPKVAGGEAPAPSEGGPKLTDESTFRSQFNQLSRNFLEGKQAFGRIGASVTNPSPAGDTALIVNYAKLLVDCL